MRYNSLATRAKGVFPVYYIYMPTKSWKNWILLVAGLVTLIMPYLGFPRGVKDFFFVLAGLAILAIAINLLWPYTAPASVRHPKKPHQHREPVPEITPPIEMSHEEEAH